MRKLVFMLSLGVMFCAEAEECQRTFSDPNKPAIMGVDTHSSFFRREIKRVLKRPLTKKQEEAIEQANHVGNKDKTEYAHIREKVKILKTAGFSRAEIRQIMQEDIVWIRRPPEKNRRPLNETNEKKLMANLKKKKSNIYFMYGVEDLMARIIRVIKENDEDFLVEVESLDPTGKIEIKEITVSKQYNIQTGLLDLNTEILFEAGKLKRKKVSRKDVQHPLPTQEEASLKQQGYGPAWTKGIDKLNEWVALKRQLQDLRAHPRITHIDYFADQIGVHLAFAEQNIGIMSQNQREFLSALKKEAKERVLKEQVTYEWWLNFNFNLSSLLSGDTGQKSLSGLWNHRLIWVISRFPLQIVMPTTAGTVGIMTFNRAQNEGLYPLGLIRSPQKVHGQLLSPFRFMEHDSVHAYDSLLNRDVWHSLGHRVRHKKILELIENLPKEKRKRAELIYFISTHENPVSDILLRSESRKEKINILVLSFYNQLVDRDIPKKMVGLGEEYNNMPSQERRKYIRDHIVEGFMREVYDPALQSSHNFGGVRDRQ